MRGINFKEKKVVPLIFMQFCHCHLNKLDRLTPQDVYYLLMSFVRTIQMHHKAINKYWLDPEEKKGGWK